MPSFLKIYYEGMRVLEIVGRPQFRDILVGQRHVVSFRQLELHFRLERAFEMHMQLAFRHTGNEIAQIAHDRPPIGWRDRHNTGAPRYRQARAESIYNVSGTGVALPSASANCGMCPRPWTRRASAPSVFFQSWPSVKITPAPTISAPAARASANVAARLEPVATTSSTTTTRRFAKSGTARRASIKRCLPADVTDSSSCTSASAK